jgi:hypothetical protein
MVGTRDSRKPHAVDFTSFNDSSSENGEEDFSSVLEAKAMLARYAEQEPVVYPLTNVPRRPHL